MKQKYQDIGLSADKLALIDKANIIIDQYERQGLQLTLRQLYYQFITRDLFPDSWADANGVKNRVQSYNKLGDLIGDGRMAGLVDWDSIVDLGRSSYGNKHYEKPSSAINSLVAGYQIDKWETQPHYVEVWVEKQALQGILQRACSPLDVRFFCCKGYTSATAMRDAGHYRLKPQVEKGKQVHILHLGDHDPSGIDMSRDIKERLTLFAGSDIHVRRIALNISQVRRLNLPPDPAKTTDSRYKEYAAKFGDESWELDALPPNLLVDMITSSVTGFRDEQLWLEATTKEEQGKGTLRKLVKHFGDVITLLRKLR